MALVAGLRLLRCSPLGRRIFGPGWLGLAVTHRWLDRWEVRFERLRRWAATLLMVAVLALVGSHVAGTAKPLLARVGGSAVKRPLRSSERAGWQPLTQAVARAVALNAGVGVVAFGELGHLLYGSRARS